MAITDQKISETTPNTFSVVTGTGCGSDGLKTVCTVYSGLVPMSPNTTPRAPSSRAPRAVGCLFVLPAEPVFAPPTTASDTMRPASDAGRHETPMTPHWYPRHALWKPVTLSR